MSDATFRLLEIVERAQEGPPAYQRLQEGQKGYSRGDVAYCRGGATAAKAGKDEPKHAGHSFLRGGIGRVLDLF